MCFQIIPLCPACEEPAGLGEDIIYADDVCAGTCQGDAVCGTTTRRLTQHELELHPDFECLTPGCPWAERLSNRSSGNSASGSASSSATHGRQRHGRGNPAEQEQTEGREQAQDEGENAGERKREGSETENEDDRDSTDNHNDNDNDDEAEVQAARDRAKQFLRARYQGCLSLCIIPFCEQAGGGTSAADGGAASLQVSA